MQLFSSLKKSGIPAAEAVLAAWLGLTTKDETVSYTHLDVYKRQVGKQWSGGGRRHDFDGVDWQALAKPATPEGREGAKDGSAEEM